MCAICRRYICPSACPSFVGDSAELGKRVFGCSGCGEAIYEDDEYNIRYGKPYCKKCTELEIYEEQEGRCGGDGYRD